MEILLKTINATLLSLGLVYGGIYYGMCQRRHVTNRNRKDEALVYELRSLYTIPAAATVAASAALMMAPLLNVLHHPGGTACAVLCGYGAWKLFAVTDRHQELLIRIILRFGIVLLTWIAIDVVLGGQPHITQTSAWMVGFANVPALMVLSLHANGRHDSQLISNMRTARLGLRVVAIATLLTVHPWIRTLCSDGCAPTLDWVWGDKSRYLVWALSAILIVGTIVILCYLEHRPTPPSRRNRKGA